ncbi:IS110 family transposase [Nocardia sp. CA-107356]|uniref:IS110 family transposase n=1 Tax=Nocardia sp. CA-107356 TaxID=3239972 RepID=UPI003D8B8B2A
MQQEADDSGSSLVNIIGVGPVVAARLLGRTGRPSRFRTSGAFAVHIGAAPIEIASTNQSRHRLSRQGDCKLNNRLHTIALTRVRMPGAVDAAITTARSAKARHTKKPYGASNTISQTMFGVSLSLMKGNEPGRRAPEDTRGRLCNPARPAQPRQPTLRTSHFRNPPQPSLRPKPFRSLTNTEEPPVWLPSCGLAIPFPVDVGDLWGRAPAAGR